MRPSQKLYMGVGSGGDADAEVVRKVITAASTTATIFHIGRLILP